MSIVTKRIIILAVIILVAAVLGRLAVRAFMKIEYNKVRNFEKV